MSEFELARWLNRSLLYFVKTILGFGEYLGLFAFLSEELDHLGKTVHQTIFEKLYSGEEIWLLGASYNTSSKLESKKSMKCGEDFCYKKSLNENKICVPGTLYFFKF